MYLFRHLILGISHLYNFPGLEVFFFPGPIAKILVFGNAELKITIVPPLIENLLSQPKDYPLVYFLLCI